MAGGGGDERSVAQKLFAIAEAFAAKEELTLTQIAAAANLPVSTAHRMLASWTEWGGRERTDSGSYRVGIKLWRLGARRTTAERLRGAKGDEALYALPADTETRDGA
mgnify:CR=1 FL=1